MRQKIIYLMQDYLTYEEQLLVGQLFVRSGKRPGERGIKRGTRRASGQYVSRYQRFFPTSAYLQFIRYIKSSNRQDLVRGELLREVYEEARQHSAIEARKILDKMVAESEEYAGHGDSATADVDYMLNNLGVSKEERDALIVPADKYNHFMKLFLTLHQNARENPDVQPFHDYVEIADQWYIFQMAWISRADATLQKWHKLGVTQRKALSEMIFAIDNKDYIPYALAPRLPTADEKLKLAQKYGVGQAGQALYEQIAGDMQAVLNHIHEIEIEQARRLIRDQGKLARALVAIDEKFAKLKSEPYFPHMRFGKFAVIVKDERDVTRYVENFESRRSAKASLFKITNAFKQQPGTFRAIIREVPFSVRPFQGLPSVMLERIRDNLSQHMSDEQLAWLDDYIQEISIATKASEKLKRRHNVSGYSRDALRAYASYFFNNAVYFSRLRYGEQMEQAIAQLDADNAASPQGTDISKRDRILGYMQDHYNYIMNPKEDWAYLRSWGFNWFLGFHVKSAFVNLSQVPLVAIPHLSAVYGDVRAWTEVTKSYTKLNNIYTKGKLEKVPPDLADALKQANDEGVINESQAAELAGIAQGRYVTQHKADTSMQKIVFSTSRYSAFLFQAMERFNRRVVFRATWNLAKRNLYTEHIDRLVQWHRKHVDYMKKQGRDEEYIRAYLAARDAVRWTQYHYANYTRPVFMRGKKGVLFTFFMFLVQTGYFAFRGKGRIRFWLVMLYTAGLMGLPGAEDLVEITKLLARTIFGKNLDLEKEVRKFVTESTDGTIPPDAILYGASRYGFPLTQIADSIGLPKAYFDLSGSMSLGQIIPGASQMANFGQDDFETTFARATTDAAGAVYGTGINIAKAMSDSQLPYNDVKRWEPAMPRFLANIAKASRLATEGRERTRTGGTVAEFDTENPVHMAELIGIALGFPSTRLNQRWDREAHLREAEKFWTIQRQMVITRFDQSFYIGSKDVRQKALDAIYEFNKEVPFPAARISIKTIVKSRKARLRERRRFESGFGVQRAYTPLVKEVDQMFPEVESLPSGN